MMRYAPTLAVALIIAAAPLTARAEQSVDQKDRQFSQSAVTVKVGEAINFSNSDQVAHDISIRNPDGSKMMSKLERPGDQATITFDKPGDYKVQCLIHPKMKMTVTAQ